LRGLSVPDGQCVTERVTLCKVILLVGEESAKAYDMCASGHMPFVPDEAYDMCASGHMPFVPDGVGHFKPKIHFTEHS